MNSMAEAGDKVTGVVADVRDFAAVGRAFETACAQFGSIDVLVSGTAGNFLAPIQIDTFHVMRAAFPHLRKPGASVINITAPQSFIPMRY